MGYSPWGHKELDRTEQCHSLTPVFLPGKSHEQKSLAGFSPQGHKRIGYDLATKQHFFLKRECQKICVGMC